MQIVAEQPADFENMLVQPAFDLAKKDEQKPENEKQSEKIERLQLSVLSGLKRFRPRRRNPQPR